MVCINRPDLQTGMVTSEDVVDRHGRVLIPKGSELSEKHLRSLKIWGVAMVHIEETEDGGNSSSTLDILPPEILAQAEQLTTPRFQHNQTRMQHPLIQFLYQHSVNSLAREIMANTAPLSLDTPFDSLRKSPPTDQHSSIPSLSELVESTETLASLPGIYHEIVVVVNHPLSSAVDVANVISGDTGLTARLLRIVNSAFYGFPATVETVSRAITLVGTNELCDLALATTVINMFDEVMKETVDLQRFWRHSLCCGTIARLLAVRRREPNAERFFVTGLLHDVGRLVLLLQIPSQEVLIMRHMQETGVHLHHAERAVLGYTHADIGRRLLQGWNLSESQQEAVLHHHHPTKHHRYALEGATVHLSDLIAHGINFGLHPYTQLPPFFPEAWTLLGQEIDILPDLLTETQTSVNDLASIFEVDS